MQRLLIVYNPHSSRHADVWEKVLTPAKKLTGYMVGRYEGEKTSPDANIKKLAKLIQEGDMVLAAGGDATGVIAANALMQSGKKAELAVLPFGNFNDLARTLRLNTLEDALTAKKVKYYPLGIYVDGKFWRWATCYVTMGMTGEAVKLYDAPKMRKKLKSKFGRDVSSYTELAKWYLKNRHKKQFIPDFALNGRAQDPRTSDYAAVNGRFMARVMRGREDYLDPRKFKSMTDRLTSGWRLTKLMTRSMVDQVPGKETKGDVLEFLRPGMVELQAEGESKVFEKAHKIEVRKGDGWFWARQK